MGVVENIRIAKENGRILKESRYSVGNKTYEFDLSFLNRSVVVSQFNELKMVKNLSRYHVRDNIHNKNSIDMILELRKNGEKGNIIALNFANAIAPGGGYLYGAVAQEECLCRSSLLYSAISKHRWYYLKDALKYTPYAKQEMIYSPNVPIIRDGEYQFIPYTEASFVTSCAVNVTILKCLTLGLYSRKRVKKVMENRIRDLFALMLDQNPSVIVLGAWGCGAYGNDREEIYDLFEEVINECIPHDEMKIIFAVV